MQHAVSRQERQLKVESRKWKDKYSSKWKVESGKKKRKTKAKD